MGRIILRGAGWLIALAAVLIVAALGYRVFRQHRAEEALRITAPNGIQEAGYVRIGGIDQWVTIRGDDKKNPVVLILHGGPGSALSAVSATFHPWEHDFTVVMWDQRGSGKTYSRNDTDEQPMTADRMVRDGIEVTQYVEHRLHKKKVVALGLSWGSELGVMMVKRGPDLFSAYVGTGQVVAKEEKEEVLYARLMQRLQAAHDTRAIAKLKTIGPPPYKSEHDLDVERDIQSRFDTEAERNQFSSQLPVALSSPDMSLYDLYAFGKGQDFAGEALYRELLSYDARKLGPTFDVPVFIFNGDRDLVTPPDLARKWFDTLNAPKKEFVILKGGGHSAILTMPDVFLAELKAHVRPVAMP